MTSRFGVRSPFFAEVINIFPTIGFILLLVTCLKSADLVVQQSQDSIWSFVYSEDPTSVGRPSEDHNYHEIKILSAFPAILGCLNALIGNSFAFQCAKIRDTKLTLLVRIINQVIGVVIIVLVMVLISFLYDSSYESSYDSLEEAKLLFMLYLIFIILYFPLTILGGVVLFDKIQIFRRVRTPVLVFGGY